EPGTDWRAEGFPAAGPSQITATQEKKVGLVEALSGAGSMRRTCLHPVHCVLRPTRSSLPRILFPQWGQLNLILACPLRGRGQNGGGKFGTCREPESSNLAATMRSGSPNRAGAERHGLNTSPFRLASWDAGNQMDSLWHIGLDYVAESTFSKGSIQR